MYSVKAHTNPQEQGMPSPYPVVTLACPTCGESVVLTYDPGFPNTHDEPGEPPEWLVQYDEHPCFENMPDNVWEDMQEAAYNSPEYRAYEYAESLV